MADLDIGLVNIQQPADELTLQYLGAAALISWKAIPAATRNLLLDNSSKITGLKHSTGVQEQVKSMLRRHGQLEG